MLLYYVVRTCLEEEAEEQDRVNRRPGDLERGHRSCYVGRRLEELCTMVERGSRGNGNITIKNSSQRTANSPDPR